jgi:hypothetical protein
MVDRSYECPFRVITGSCMGSKVIYIGLFSMWIWSSVKDVSIHHVHKVIGNLSRLVIRRVRKSKDRSQLSDLALEVCQNLLIAFVGFDLAHGARLEFSRHLVQVSLFVTLQGVFELCSETALSTLSVSVSEGEFGFLAFKHKR